MRHSRCFNLIFRPIICGNERLIPWLPKEIIRYKSISWIQTMLLRHNKTNVNRPLLNTQRVKLLNHNSTVAPVSLPPSGIPRTDSAPFLLPSTNTKRNTDRFMQALVVIRQYAEMVLPAENTVLALYISNLFSYIDTSYNRSPFHTIKNLQLLVNWFKVYVLSGSREQGDIQIGMWSSKGRAPVQLQHIVKYLESTKDPTLRIILIRLVLSMLSVYKVLTVPVEPSLESITNPFSGVDEEGNCIHFIEVFKSLCIDLGGVREDLKAVSEAHQFHESMAAGPNGHAVWAAHLDAYELSTEVGLMGYIRDLAKALGLKHVIHSLDNVLGIFSAVDVQSLDFTGGCHSRLHVIFEKGIKSRVIAIGDYYTQSVLSPFHTILANILRGLPADATFNQQAGFAKIKAMSVSSDELNSLDLSKATDRLPRKAQIRMMEALLGDKNLARLWGDLLGNRTFVTETGHKVRYTVGQPMGFKSSFPAMALIHHCIVTQAAINAGLKHFDAYVILGDDIVIASNLVTSEYVKIMKLLGMEISPTKSVSPVQGIKCGAEFCSRLVVDGVELTPLPIHAIVEVINNGEGLVSLWEVLHERSLFVGQRVWEFLAIFVQQKELEFLMMLNALPSEVSGLKTVLQALGADSLSLEAMEKLGFTPSDITNFYFYVLLSETMSKIDAAVKRTVNLVSIFDTEGRTRPEGHDIFLSGTVASLAMLVNSQAKKLPESLGLIHPIQGVIKTIGGKILALLNMFSGSGVDYKSLLSSPLLSILNFRLDKKAAYTGGSESAFGDRRVLEKALRLLFRSIAKDGSKNVSYTGKIEGVTQLWLVSVAPGKPLLVVPHVPKLENISVGGSTRLNAAIKSSGFSVFASSIPQKVRKGTNKD